MSSNFSAYKITLLLYIGVLFVPFGFFYTYNNIKDSQSDITVVRTLGQIGTGILIYSDTADKAAEATKISRDFKKIEPWFNANNNSEFYVGGRTLQKDFHILKECWGKLQNKPHKEKTLQCIKTVDSLSFTVDKMHLLKQKKIKNIFYMTIIGTLIFLLLLIYFVRSYIDIQLKKHAIHDYETKLYNKKYLMAELKTTCARSIRHNYALSLLSITIENYEKDQYDKKSRAHLFGKIGGLIMSQTRESDVACRFDENHFLIILPFTDLSQAEQFEKRIKKAFEDHDFIVEPEPTFKFSAVAFKEGETPETCVLKAQELCCPDKKK